MLLGRNPGLWLGAVVALLNVAVVVLGVQLTVEQVAALNAAAAALVALVANAGDPSAIATFAPRLMHDPALGDPPRPAAATEPDGKPAPPEA